jgi:branched-chain amino acid aminotransferase
MKACLNGELVALEKLRIDPFDRGFSLGDGLFETILARSGHPLRLEAHLARLRAGALITEIPLPWSNEVLAEFLQKVLSENGLSDAVLRLTLTRGVGARGVLPPQDGLQPTLLIVPYKNVPHSLQSVSAIVSQKTRRNEHSPLSRCKSLNFLDNVIARLEAHRKGADDAILLNTKDHLAEATSSNLFLVIKEGVVTPPVSDGALPGVMRAAVMALLKAQERSLSQPSFDEASEAFLTNALGVRALVNVDGKKIGTGQPGPVFKGLLERLDKE